MNRHITRLALAAALAASACSSPPVRPTTGKPAPPRLPPNAVAVTVEVVEQQAADAWEVTWSLSRPVDGVRFDRQVTRFRGAAWALSGSDARFVELGAAEAVVPTSGRLRRFTVRFTTEGGAPPTEELVIPYGDGARLVHTGPLMVTPLECFRPTACEPGDLEPPRGYIYHGWRLRADAGRHLALLGAHGVATLDYDQPRDTVPRGHRAYFGPSPAPGSGSLELFIDQSLPPWILETLGGSGAVLDHYAGATAQPLPGPASLWVSRTDADLPGRFMTAGTVEGGVHLELRGGGWAERSPESLLLLRQRVARELFRLWNEQLIRSTGGSRAAWFVDGGAEYVALAALRHLGHASPSEVTSFVARQANRCLLRLGGRSLEDAGVARARGATTSCGATLHALLDHDEAAEGGILALYERLWSDPQRASHAPADVLVGSSAARALARRLVSEGIPSGADAALHSALRDAGFATTLVAPGEALVDATDLRDLLVRTLTECDCGRPLSATVVDGGVLFKGRAECDVFAEDYVLASIDGHRVLDDPGAAWAALARAIKHIARFELGRVEGAPARTRKCPVALLDPSWERLLAPM